MERADEAALDSAVLDLSGETAGEEVRDDTSPFFVSKKAAAVLKHAILDKYVVPFASKVGKYAPDGRVVYLDGYAGPGRYDDGTPGSPALILESAAAIADFRKLDCYFIEKNRKNFQSLSQLVAEAREQGLDAHALQGRVERHLDHVLEAAQGPRCSPSSTPSALASPSRPSPSGSSVAVAQVDSPPKSFSTSMPTRYAVSAVSSPAGRAPRGSRPP